MGALLSPCVEIHPPLSLSAETGRETHAERWSLLHYTTLHYMALHSTYTTRHYTTLHTVDFRLIEILMFPLANGEERAREGERERDAMVPGCCEATTFLGTGGIPGIPIHTVSALSKQTRS